mmetsp:Transcript_1110/g.1682  ORF Transcript_1110/g.1682 Transcript_1110/m.1682 type:complete len:134 (-) Transcript_1110:188-589(-)
MWIRVAPRPPAGGLGDDGNDDGGDSDADADSDAVEGEEDMWCKTESVYGSGDKRHHEVAVRAFDGSNGSDSRAGNVQGGDVVAGHMECRLDFDDARVVAVVVVVRLAADDRTHDAPGFHRAVPDAVAVPDAHP